MVSRSVLFVCLIGLADQMFSVGNKPPFKLNERGYFDWKVTVAGRTVVTRVTAEDLRAFASWDTSIVWKSFPSATDVLTVHGMADTVVPP